MVASAVLTMLVTDVVESTSLRVARGDPMAHERFALMQSVVTRIAEGRGGRYVKNTGDGQLMVFGSARSAVSAAVEMQQNLHLLNAEDPAHAAFMRAGINTGETIIDADDVQGTAVVAAFRINARAAGEQILVSEMVRGVLGGTDEFSFLERGRFALKGLRGRWRLYELPWRPVPVSSDERECAILFSDIRNSTGTAMELDEHGAFQYLRSSHAILRAAAVGHSALFFRLIGDGGLMTFSDVQTAILAADTIRKASTAYTEENPTTPMVIGMGVHRGAIIREADEIYGKALFIAARTVGEAGAGEVLVTEEALDALPAGAFAFGDPRSARMKAIPGARLLYPLR